MAKTRRPNSVARKNVEGIARRKRRRSAKSSAKTQLKIKVEQLTPRSKIRKQQGAPKNQFSKVPVVVLDRCYVSEDLLKKLYHRGDNMVSDVATAAMSNVNNSYGKIGGPMRRAPSQKQPKQPSATDSLNFLRSFKITAALNSDERSRKIDVISLPIETKTTGMTAQKAAVAARTTGAAMITPTSTPVSMKIETSKTATRTLRRRRRPLRKLGWRLRNTELADAVLADVFRVTSSSELFKSGRLEYDPVTSAMSIMMSPTRPLSLSRSTSNTSLNTMSNLKFEESSVKTIGRPLFDEHSSGYHSTSSTVSSPKRRVSGEEFRDISVTIDCGSSSSSASNRTDTTIAVNKRRCDFKMPRLPLSKRPPTRIKFADGGVAAAASITSPKFLPIVQNDTTTIADDNFDAISLFAESSCFQLDREDERDDVDDDNRSRDRAENLLDCQTSNNTTSEMNSADKSTYKKERTNISFGGKNVVQSPTKNKLTPPKLNSERVNVKSPSQLVTKEFLNNKDGLPKPLRNTPSQVDTSNINEWIAATSTPKNPVSTGMVLGCLKGICHWHFTTRTCYKGSRCYFRHKLDGSFLNNLRELNVDQFQVVLKEIIRYQYLFKDHFDAILSYYKENNHSQELVYLIEDILNLNFDKTPFVKAVVSTLKDLGYTFVDAISEILWTHGTKTQSLMDILLMIIVEEDDCLENNWHFVDKITKFRKEKLDYGVVTEIFQKCCNADSLNRTFCENIYKDLIIKSHIELDKINRDLVIKYVDLLYHFDFTYYAEQLKQNYRIADRELTNVKKARSASLPRNTIVVSASVYDQENVECKPLLPASTNNTRPSSSSSSTSITSATTSDSASTTGSNADSEGEQDAPPNDIDRNERTDVDETKANTYSEIDGRVRGSGEEQAEEVEEEQEEEEDDDEESEGEEDEEEEEAEHITMDEHENEVAMNEMEDEYGLLTKVNGSVERSCRFQINATYTHSDLETYLNYVNRDTYLTQSYYSMDESPPKNAAGNVDTTKQQPMTMYKSSDSGHSFNPPSAYTPGNGGRSSSSVQYNPQVDGGSIRSESTPTRGQLTDDEIMKLVAAVNMNNMSAILSMMSKAADNNMCRSFVAHTVTALKNMLPPKAYKLIADIFDNLGNLASSHPSNQSSNMRQVMASLAFNILPFLDHKKEYPTATRLIRIFIKELDSFVTTESITNYEWLSTTKLRYVFIFKFFVRDLKLREALKLLKNSHLSLFQMAPNEKDAEYKQRLLGEFVDKALQNDLPVAKESILYLMLNMDSLQNFLNLGKWLNQLMVKFLNSYADYKYDLFGLIDNITNGWFKHLKQSVMRAIFVHISHDLPEQKVMEFFNLCVEIGIYHIHEGFDNSIEIPMDLLPEEIQFILHVHFYKICKSNFPLQNIVITTKRQINSDEYTNLIHALRGGNVDNRETMIRILNTFNKFEYFPTPDKMNIMPGMITIPYDHLKYFFIPYRTELPSITKLR